METRETWQPGVSQIHCLWHHLGWGRQCESEKVAYKCLPCHAAMKLLWIGRASAFWFPLQRGFAELSPNTALKEHTHTHTHSHSYTHSHIHIFTQTHTYTLKYSHTPTHSSPLPVQLGSVHWENKPPLRWPHPLPPHLTPHSQALRNLCSQQVETLGDLPELPRPQQPPVPSSWSLKPSGLKTHQLGTSFSAPLKPVTGQLQLLQTGSPAPLQAYPSRFQ